MSQINNISPNNPIQQIVNNPVQKQIPAEATQAPSDSVELSGVSNYMQILKTNDVRPAKIAAIRTRSKPAPTTPTAQSLTPPPTRFSTS